MLTEILVPIFVCVILPVAIVWIVFYSIQKRNANETQIILESLRTHPEADAEKLIKLMKRPLKAPWQDLNRKLLRGSIFTLMGIAFAFLGIFCENEELVFGNWVFCGVLSAVGIGFLITYWFAYRHIDKSEKEYTRIVEDRQNA